MLAITTPFICNLEGFCTYSGSLLSFTRVQLPGRLSVPQLAKHQVLVTWFKIAPLGADQEYSALEGQWSALRLSDLCQWRTLGSSLEQMGQNSPALLLPRALFTLSRETEKLLNYPRSQAIARTTIASTLMPLYKGWHSPVLFCCFVLVWFFSCSIPESNGKDYEKFEGFQ